MKSFQTSNQLFALFLLSGSGLMSAAQGQMSLATAVDLALSHSPKVQMAAADVAKAKASLAQSKDAYLPSASTVIGAAGDSWGYTASVPTAFTITVQSLVFDWSEQGRVRAARFGIHAAELSLADAREGVEEETTLSYLQLQHDVERQSALEKQYGFAQRLVRIVDERLAAGQDTSLELTRAKLTSAQIRLALLKAKQDADVDREHLSRVLGLTTPATIASNQPLPQLPALDSLKPALGIVREDPAIASAFADAEAKWQIAKSDSHLFRPQFAFFGQYNRFATWFGSFGKLEKFNPNVPIGLDQGGAGIQITLPIFDRNHRDKVLEEAADAVHARAVATNAQFLAEDGRAKLSHSLEVLEARAEVAELDQQLAKLQLDAITTQLEGPATANGAAPLTPKDEQSARIAERDRFLALLDARFQLAQSEIQLLRQTGKLEAWIKQSLTAP